MTTKIKQHKVGDIVAITKGHGFFGGSLGDVIKTTTLHCTIKLVCPWLKHGLMFHEVTGLHEDFEPYDIHQYE